MKTKAVQMIRKMSLGGSLLMMFFLCGCNSSLSNTRENINTEGVMKEGDRIVATNPDGTLTITAGKDNVRYLTLSGKYRSVAWLGDTVCVKLTEGNIKYRNSLIGFHCDSNVKKIRTEEGFGPTRVEMGEAQLHFDNLKTAKKFLDPNAYDECCDPQLWSSDGLYINWGYVVPEYWFFPKQSYLDVELFQIYVDGSKSSDLPKARNDKITVEHLTDEQLKAFEKSVKPFFYFF
jgi:hypothetical protein